jgi:hypothetical protein
VSILLSFLFLILGFIYLCFVVNLRPPPLFHFSRVQRAKERADWLRDREAAAAEAARLRQTVPAGVRYDPVKGFKFRLEVLMGLPK